MISKQTSITNKGGKVMYKLLLDSGRQRLYELSEPSTYSEHDPEIKPYELVVVSDAHTHCERLAFAAYRVESDVAWEYVFDGLAEKYYVDWNNVTGYWTMMIYGGDSNTMFPDEYYLNKITGGSL